MMAEPARRLCLSQERGFQDRVRSRNSGDHGFPGQSVYDYALTAGQIAAHYATGTGN